MLKFNGKEIELPWSGWGGVKLCPEGLITRRGLIKIDQLELAQWSHCLPRPMTLTFIDKGGYEHTYRLEKLSSK